MILKALVGTVCAVSCGAALAAEWRVEVTNVTPGQSFTPILAVAHYPPARLFELGAPSTTSTVDRAADFVASRLRFHETLHPLGLLQRRHDADPAAAAAIDMGRTLLADQVRDYFRRDLEPLDDERRDDVVTTIAALTSIESWHQSHHSHGRSPAQIRRAWIGAITALLAGAPSIHN